VTEPTPKMVRLKCSSCGTRPTGLEAKYAKVGGTHYKRITHGAGIPGHRGGFQARTCGTWVKDHG
jgi:hypothetical protein